MTTAGEAWRSNPVPAWLGDGSVDAPTEDDLEQERVEAELMAYAHRAAQSWGAQRFAEEFHRREQEELEVREQQARLYGMFGETGPYAGLAPSAENGYERPAIEAMTEVPVVRDDDLADDPMFAPIVVPPLAPGELVDDAAAGTDNVEPATLPIRSEAEMDQVQEDDPAAAPAPAPSGEPEEGQPVDKRALEARLDDADEPSGVVGPADAVAALRSILASKKADDHEDPPAAQPSARSSLQSQLLRDALTAARRRPTTPEPVLELEPTPTSYHEPPPAVEPAAASVEPAADSVEPPADVEPPAYVEPAAPVASEPVATPEPVMAPGRVEQLTPEPIGPVLAETEDRVSSDHDYGLELRRPAVVKHAHIPRPPKDEPSPESLSRRERRRAKKERKKAPAPSSNGQASAIMEAQYAQMSPAGRRLYGLDPLPDEREQTRLDQEDLARMMTKGPSSDV